MKLVPAVFTPLLLLIAAPGVPSAQQPAAEAAPSEAPHPAHTVTHHRITIGGARISYDATVGSMILTDSRGKPAGEIYYTAYTRTDGGDTAQRPLTFAYNGGPGSASVWLQMGALGPRRVVTPDTAHAPPPPYAVVDNQYSPLDVTDLVFIDPIGTGFSHPLGDTPGSAFWGVDQDARSLEQFITRYLSENGRWNSPRYLLGESYGTTRSAVLAKMLQSQDDVDLNGVILMSPVLNFQTIAFAPGNPLPYILYLPAYAAVAWYHHVLPEEPAALRPFLRQVERFATGEYAQALFAGDRLDPAERARVVHQLHQYTGLSEEYLDRADIRVDGGEFAKELFREKGLAIGRLDARFAAPAGDPLAERVTFDPLSAAVGSAFTSAWNHYLRTELGFHTDRAYVVLGNVQPWDWTHGPRGAWPGYTDVAGDLADAMRYNPRLQVLVNGGLFDLATPYFATEYTVAHLRLPPALRGNIRVEEYDAGHMMYLHEPALARLRENIVSFIERTSGAER
jgi:carboxypeptidase C (cathepsin A)